MKERSLKESERKRNRGRKGRKGRKRGAEWDREIQKGEREDENEEREEEKEEREREREICTHTYVNQFLFDVPYKSKYSDVVWNGTNRYKEEIIIITSCQLCTYGGGVSQIFFIQGGKRWWGNIKKHFNAKRVLNTYLVIKIKLPIGILYDKWNTNLFWLIWYLNLFWWPSITFIIVTDQIYI